MRVLVLDNIQLWLAYDVAHADCWWSTCWFALAEPYGSVWERP